MYQIDASGMQSGSHTENHAGSQRSAKREKQNAPVNRYFVEPRQTFGQDSQQRRLGEEENRDAGQPTEQRKQQTLGQQLTHQPRRGGSQRLPNRHFAASCAGARKKQVRNIHAADQQDQSHSAQQQYQRLVNIAYHAFLERHQAQRPPGLQRVIVGKLFL